MSQTIQHRLEGIVKAKLRSIALSQRHEFDVSACYAPVMDANGQVNGLGHSWLVTVSVPNPLLGNPAIAVSLPINGVAPPDQIFEQCAEFLYQKCVEEKDKLMQKPTAVGMNLEGAVK
jgi:hypothetical protein